jgi:hypothetical protein
MNKIANYAVWFIVGEIVAGIFFSLLRDHFAVGQEQSEANLATAKGSLERLVLFIGLLNGYVSVLIVFGTLKISTRLHEDNKSKISNDYFLVGNLVTILISMTVTLTALKFTT